MKLKKEISPNYCYNIHEDILSYWYLITDWAGEAKVGATVIGTGGGCDYIMVRGESDCDYLLTWADDEGGTDASAPDSLYSPAAIVLQYNENEGFHNGRQNKQWGCDIHAVLYLGTAKECMDVLAKMPGVPFESRDWEGSW